MKSSFILIAEYYLTVYYITVGTHSLLDVHLGCFQFFTIKNNYKIKYKFLYKHMLSAVKQLDPVYLIF